MKKKVLHSHMGAANKRTHCANSKHKYEENNGSARQIILDLGYILGGNSGRITD